MKRFFLPNISGTGRRTRGWIAVALFIASGFGFAFCVWLGVALASSGVFLLFEALRGWCALRACGIKTRL
ncbi:MAG TPA: hypothetical protein VME24_06330 [Alphaproteobacteria bacterium]|nr:hypothetical protein [Alphaproteobacteria bacterium]